MARTPRPTWRGWGVASVAVAAVLLGYLFGGRSLNAVAVPAATAFLATGLYVARVGRTQVERDAPGRGHQGEHRTVSLTVDAGVSTPITLVDEIGGGLRGDGRFETAADGRTVTYDLELAARGVHQLGPTRTTVRDPLGLWYAVHTNARTDRVLVYPRVHDLRDTADLLAGYIGITNERGQFDAVREYQRGDPLRDVNWRASAKRPQDLVVTTFAGEGALNRVLVAVESPGPREDAVAEAAASVACHLLDAGIAVGLATPGSHVDPASGTAQRRRTLDALARFDGGVLRESVAANADIVVTAPADGEHVEIEVEGRRRRYSEVVGGEASA